MTIELNDNTWQFVAYNYFGFIKSKDLEKFADVWEQTELVKILFLQGTT